MQELVDWCIKNAFNIESQSGNEYVAIDYEEMRKEFDRLIELERQQIVDAFYIGNDISSDEPDGVEYYNNNFTNKLDENT